MNEQLTIACVKYMLRDARPHAVIRLVMMLIEQGHATAPDNPILFNSEHKLLKNHFEKVGAKSFIEDLKALATLSSPEMSSTLILSKDKAHVYEFTFSGIKAYFSLPVRQGRLTVVKSSDKIKNKVQRVWSRWVERIGSRKDIYKNGISLTSVREKAITNALNVRSEESLYDVIEGCLRSPHHMGYTIDRKTGLVTKSKRYCCPTTIFRNEKIMDGLLSRLSEPMFETQIEEANKRHSLRSFTAHPVINAEGAAPTFAPVTTSTENLNEEEPQQPNLMQMILQGNFDQTEPIL